MQMLQPDILLLDRIENRLIFLLERIQAFFLGRCHGISPSAFTSNPLSSARSVSLVSRPPPKPVSFPLLPITRWQGTTIGIGFAPLARPTARDPLGLPMRRASSP